MSGTDYQGTYSKNGHVLTRTTDGQTLLILPSKKAGHFPFYVLDGGTRRFVSSLFERDEFECDRRRYRITDRGDGAVEIAFLRVSQPRRREGPAWPSDARTA